MDWKEEVLEAMEIIDMAHPYMGRKYWKHAESPTNETRWDNIKIKPKYVTGTPVDDAPFGIFGPEKKIIEILTEKLEEEYEKVRSGKSPGNSSSGIGKS